MLNYDLMGTRDRFSYAVVCFVFSFIFIYMYFGDLSLKEHEMDFVEREGNKFMLNGKPVYVNGWNSYWLMDQAVEESSRHRVREILEAGSKMGLSVCRTWAFNDGSYNALQVSPGRFDERVFQALDRVLAEAKRSGIRLILSLVNNLEAYGGKTQYVKWAWEEGVALSPSNDSFFYDPTIRSYYKAYVKAILTRKNSITGIEYRNDPVIFAWELMNEPRCLSDSSGDSLQDWLEEMSEFVKSIDRKHLVTVGLEGFYGRADPLKLMANPGQWAGDLGSDFTRNFMIPAIDFASVHVYPDSWCKGSGFGEKLKFVSKWALSHIEDGDMYIKKPVLFTEFGLSNKSGNFQASQRYEIYKTIFDIIYKSAKERRSGAGAFPWQFMAEGMEEYNDDFGFVPSKMPEIYNLMTQQSCRLAAFHGKQHSGMDCSVVEASPVEA